MTGFEEESRGSTLVSLVEHRSARLPDDVAAGDGVDVALTRPSWLLPEAKREWNRIVPQLRKWGLETVDRMALASVCQEWARYVECQKTIAKLGVTYVTPTGYTRPRPEVAQAAGHLAAIERLSTQFGATLAARNRIAAPRTEEPHDDLLD